MGLRVLFGRYSGTAVEDLPDDYLDWLHRQAWLRPPLKPAIDREHARRAAGRHDDGAGHRGAGDHGRRAGDAAGEHLQLRDPGVRQAAHAIVRRGLAAVAKELHPDRTGGDVRMMQNVNLAAEALRTLLAS